MFFLLSDFLIVLVLVLVLILFVCLFVSSLQKSVTLKFHSIFHPLSGSKETIYNSMRKPS